MYDGFLISERFVKERWEIKSLDSFYSTCHFIYIFHMYKLYKMKEYKKLLVKGEATFFC